MFFFLLIHEVLGSKAKDADLGTCPKGVNLNHSWELTAVLFVRWPPFLVELRGAGAQQYRLRCALPHFLPLLILLTVLPLLLQYFPPIFPKNFIAIHGRIGCNGYAITDARYIVEQQQFAVQRRLKSCRGRPLPCRQENRRGQLWCRFRWQVLFSGLYGRLSDDLWMMQVKI